MPRRPIRQQSYSGRVRRSAPTATGAPRWRILWTASTLTTGYSAPETAAGGDIPGVEAMQEFRVLTHDYSAAFGGAAGAGGPVSPRVEGSKETARFRFFTARHIQSVAMIASRVTLL